MENIYVIFAQPGWVRFCCWDAGVENPGDAQLLDPRQFDVGQDEVSCTDFDRANSALVGRPG